MRSEKPPEISNKRNQSPALNLPLPTSADNHSVQQVDGGAHLPLKGQSFSTRPDIADKKAIGARIKALRKARHWPQKQLALKIGVRYEQLNKYEGGFHIPGVSTLVRLADALDTTMDYLVTGTEVEQSNLASIRLFRRFQALEGMAEEDQQTVVRIIDALIAQQRMVSVLVPVD